MKTFTATELFKNSGKVYRIADLEGEVRINHSKYPDIIFVLSSRKRIKENLHEFMAKYPQDKSNE